MKNRIHKRVYLGKLQKCSYVIPQEPRYWGQSENTFKLVKTNISNKFEEDEERFQGMSH